MATRKKKAPARKSAFKKSYAERVEALKLLRETALAADRAKAG